MYYTDPIRQRSEELLVRELSPLIREAVRMDVALGFRPGELAYTARQAGGGPLSCLAIEVYARRCWAAWQ